MKSSDAIIIGGGIAGASVGYYLAPHMSLTLLEAEPHFGMHTTGRSAALLIPSYGGPVVRDLTARSKSFFLSPPEPFPSLLGVWRGAAIIAPPGRVDDLPAILADQRDSSPNAVIEQGDVIEKRFPLLKKNAIEACLYDPDVADIEVDALLQGFLAAIRARGSNVIASSRAVQIKHSRGIWRVDTEQDSFEAPVIVNAAGAWAAQIGAMAGASPVGLTPCRRSAALVRPPVSTDMTLWPAMLDIGERFYMKPDAGKLLISPNEEVPVVPMDAYVDDFDLAVGIDAAQQILDFPIERIDHSWAGLRTFAADREPVIGEDHARPGFFWSAGHGGYGIQTAPAWGQLLASLICRQSLTGDASLITATSPSRFNA